MTKPKKLYRYGVNHDLSVHETHSECIPQIVEHKPHGTLWRCRHSSHDCYGYDQRKSAEIEELEGARGSIGQLKNWIEILEGRKSGSKQRMPL